MRLLFLTLGMTVLCVVGYGQNETGFSENATDSLSEAEKNILGKRTWANNFTQTLNKIGDPSVASFLFTDYNHNTDPSKQKKGFILNTTIQPIVGIGGKRWYIGNYVHTFQVIPTIAIRIFQNDSAFMDHSMPVRTPGFMAKFNYYFSHARLWSDTSKWRVYFGASMFHHSNGQDGYEFVESQLKGDSLVNTHDGNFSELLVFEFMTGGMKVSERKLKEKRNSRNDFPRKLQFDSKNSIAYWKLSYEFHPYSLSSEKFERYNIYGRKRLNLQLGYLFNPRSRHIVYSKQRQKWIPLENSYQNREIRRFVFNFSYILDLNYNVDSHVVEQQIAPFFDVSKRMNIDLTWYERIGSTSDFSVFMRVGYYGSDPYNIYFQESIYVARVGIAFGNFLYGERK